MAFLLGPALGALSSLLFKKKGGKIVQQTPNGQAFMQAKPVALKNGGFVDGLRAMTILPTPIRRKKGGRIPKKSKTKKQKK
jgi:hypothetical protein